MSSGLEQSKQSASTIHTKATVEYGPPDVVSVGARRAAPPLRALGLALVGSSLPFYWLAILTAATTQLPVLFLAERSEPAEVGLYAASLRLASPVQVALLSAIAALYPSLSRHGAGDPERLSRDLRREALVVGVGGSVGALGVTLARSEVVVLLYGADFLPAADALAYQCWHSVLVGIFSLIGTALAALDLQRRLALLATGYAALGVPILWLGAGRGAAGLALAAVVTGVVNLTYHWLVLNRSLPRPLTTRFALTLCSAMAGAAAVGWIVPQGLPVVSRAMLAAVAVVLLLVVATRRLREKRYYGCRVRPGLGVRRWSAMNGYDGSDGPLATPPAG